MLETLDSLTDTQGGENSVAETISRKDIWAAWLAGIIDGEGNISAEFGRQTNPRERHLNTLRIRVRISNTHPLLIQRITEVLILLGVEFGNVAINGYRTKTPGAKHYIDVIIEGKGRLRKLLPLVIPYLTAKKRQAELALDLINYRESLAIHGRESKGRFSHMTLSDDPVIQEYIRKIKSEKHDYESVLGYSRKPNQVFSKSSETLRFPSLIKDDQS